jgi:iron complex transport system substrate-binding protein
MNSDRKIWLFLLIALLGSAPIARATTVVDEAGRKIRLPGRIDRIVSLAPSITEIIFALDQGHRLAAVTQFSNYPPQAKQIPRVGSYVNLDIEKILAVRPDLVIGIKDGNPKHVVDRLAELGVPSFIINPKNLQEVIRSIRKISQVIGAQAAAAHLTRQMSERIRQVQKSVAGSSSPRVFIQIGVEPIVSAGRGTFIDVLIKLAGGTNAAGEMAGYPHLNLEQVFVARPEIIFITSMARQGSFAEVKRFWQKWPGLPAVENERIYIIDSDLCDRPSPRIVEGLEILARKIHPERFKKK